MTTRMSVVRMTADQSDPDRRPVTLSYGEDPNGLVAVSVPTAVGETVHASISTTDLLRFARLVQADRRKA